MSSPTRRVLQDFDNQHDFERMAADLLNGFGFASVEPMAAAGGPDGGSDIKFKQGTMSGIAFVTLQKKIESKFKKDLAKQESGEGLIALFCNVDVSPSQKIRFAEQAIKKGYQIEIYDLERIRMLLDTTFIGLRQKYLMIENPNNRRAENRIRLSPKFHDNPVIMNGGNSGGYANYQIRFGSDTDLELIEAALIHDSVAIHCEPRDSKLEGGQHWNHLQFAIAKLPFLHNAEFQMRVVVTDHLGARCELTQQLIMKQFPPNPDKHYGRWEIHSKGIFKIEESV